MREYWIWLLSLIRIIYEGIDRTRSTPAAHRVIECYCLGTREAQAQPYVWVREGRRKLWEWKRRDSWEGARGQRKCIASTAVRCTRWEKWISMSDEYALSWEILLAMLIAKEVKLNVIIYLFIINMLEN